jgi:hypothetical protein
VKNHGIKTREMAKREIAAILLIIEFVMKDKP